MTDARKALAVVHPRSTAHVAYTLARGALTENGATPWYATVGLGTPPQPLRFMIDTGTTNTWITASRCHTVACDLHGKFDPEKSSTFHDPGEPAKEVNFGPWGNMQVVLGDDVCHLEREADGKRTLTPLDEPMSIYLAIDYQGQQFAELDCDGGFAIPAIPWQTPSSLMEQLWRQGLIRFPVASFSFDAQTGQGSCLMGAVDPAHFDETTLNVLPVTPLEGDLAYLWTVNLDCLLCGGRSLGTNLSFVLDTGSSVFKGGNAVIGRMLDAITGGGLRPQTVSDPAALADYPDLQLAMGNSTYRLTPWQYFMLEKDGLWHLGVQYLEGLPDELLVVGSVFLDTVYSAYFFNDAVFSEPTVLLARPRGAARSVTGIWQNQFNSTLRIGPVAPDGTFTGSYSSHTGATGVYPVMGVADPSPDGETIPVSFSVTWRSLVGAADPSWHWVSGFTGLWQKVNGKETINTTYLLQQNATSSVPDWMATAVYGSTFTRVEG